MTLLRVVNNRCLLPVFRIYCRSQGVDEYLNFWFDVRMYTNKYLTEKEGSLPEKADSKQLWKKFFHPESIHRIDAEPKTLKDLQDAIESAPCISSFAGNEIARTPQPH